MTTATTAATEAAFSFDSIKEMMDAFDPASLLPALNSIFDKLALICRIAVLVGPVLLLLLGLSYLFLTPREANHYVGYRCYFGMGSVEAWRFTQRLAGICFVAAGLILGVIALISSRKFGNANIDAMVFYAAKTLLVQGGLAVVLNLGILLTTFLTFDAKGEYRKKK